MSNTIYPTFNPMCDWNSYPDNTYHTGEYDEKRNPIYKSIPEHPYLRDIYNDVFNYARDGYMYVGTSFEKCMEMIKEKYGDISSEMENYLKRCAYDGGSRAGLLIEDPNHYD